MKTKQGARACAGPGTGLSVLCENPAIPKCKKGPRVDAVPAGKLMLHTPDNKLECKSKRNAAGLSATIAFTPSDCRRFPAGPVAFSRTGRARNAPKHGIRASAGHAHASPAQSFAGLSATPVRFSLPGRFFRLFSPVNYLLPPSRDGFRTTSSGLIRTIPSSPSRSLGRSLEAACRGVFPPRLLLG